MNKIPTYLIAVLLMFFFSAKTTIPLFAHINHEEKIVTEKQEEKSGEKPDNVKTEIAEIAFPQYAIVSLKTTLAFPNKAHAFLPVQYFAIPTPPPWC